jgi:prepilin-type N-terminal cleavage/methylation domain-containing protein
MSCRRAFTLIEVLLAVALLTMLATAAVSWAVSQRRSGALIEARYERVQQVLACQQAIEEDLMVSVFSAAPLRPDDEGRLVVATLRRLPDEHAGRREVIWSFDGEHRALIRTSRDVNGERRRVALAELTAARFVQDERRGLVLIVQPPIGEAISVALRSGR